MWYHTYVDPLSRAYTTARVRFSTLRSRGIILLRLLRGELCGLDLLHLALRQAYLARMDAQDTNLAGAMVQDCVFTETFDVMTAVAISSTGVYWAASSTRGEVRLWAAGGLTLHRMWRAHSDMGWALTFSPDGRTLASASWDGTVRLWDTSALRHGSELAALSADVPQAHLWRTLMASCICGMPPTAR